MLHHLKRLFLSLSLVMSSCALWLGIMQEFWFQNSSGSRNENILSCRKSFRIAFADAPFNLHRYYLRQSRNNMLCLKSWHKICCVLASPADPLPVDRHRRTRAGRGEVGCSAAA